MKKQGNNTLLFFGEVLKTFGINGELIVKLSADAPEEVNTKEPLFIVIDGLSVPFYIKSLEHKGNHKLRVVFDDMETENAASELVKKKIYYYANKQQENHDSDSSDFIGYLLVDSQLGELGKITEFFDFPGNPCFQLLYNEKEVLIPVNEDLIEGIDADKKIITLNLPEGLMDI